MSLELNYPIHTIALWCGLATAISITGAFILAMFTYPTYDFFTIMIGGFAILIGISSMVGWGISHITTQSEEVSLFMGITSGILGGASILNIVYFLSPCAFFILFGLPILVYPLVRAYLIITKQYKEKEGRIRELNWKKKLGGSNGSTET